MEFKISEEKQSYSTVDEECYLLNSMSNYTRKYTHIRVCWKVQSFIRSNHFICVHHHRTTYVVFVGSVFFLLCVYKSLWFHVKQYVCSPKFTVNQKNINDNTCYRFVVGNGSFIQHESHQKHIVISLSVNETNKSKLKCVDNGWSTHDCTNFRRLFECINKHTYVNQCTCDA